MSYKFEQAKLKRLLSMYGTEYHFERLKKDEYGDIADPQEIVETFDIIGIYHEVSQGIKMEVGSETRYRTEKQPFILAMYENASMLLVDDILECNNVKYKVIGVHNVHNLNVYGDISLEVVDDGKNNI